MLTPLTLLRQEAPSRAVFSPDGSRFVLASGSRLVLYSREGERIVEAELPRRGRLKPFVHGLSWSSDDLHLAVAENPTLRLRSAADLSIVAENEAVRMGPVAFCEGGRALAVGAVDRSLHVLEVPTLADRGALRLEQGHYDSFDIVHVVADPAGPFVAATDYGGYSDDDWGHTKDRGTPKLTLVDAGTPGRSVKELTQPQPITGLAFDRWRRRLIVSNDARVVVRTLDGALITEWTPYGRPSVDVLAVCDRFVATVPDVSWGAPLTLDLWDPVTYRRLARTPLLEGSPRSVVLAHRPRFVLPSPDGSRLVVPEPEGVRLWSVGPR